MYNNINTKLEACRSHTYEITGKFSACIIGKNLCEILACVAHAPLPNVDFS